MKGADFDIDKDKTDIDDFSFNATDENTNDDLHVDFDF
jgi:hypothetical protein